MINEEGKVRGLQIILPKAAQGESNKTFLSGAETKGLFFWVGAKTETVCVCEGVATAASVHEATGRRWYISFSAGNLAAVGRIIREKLPNAQIVFCGDNDKSGTGQAAATEAALLVDGLVSIPPEIGEWNDFINQGGAL
jgi:putative DNA primase/helicase